MRLLTYNIRYGGIGREERLADVISACDPDLVLLQEATRPVVVERLATLTGMSTWGSQRGESLGFLSRVPVARHAWRRPRRSRHAFLEIAPGETKMRIFGVHLSAVHSAWTERRRVRELRALLAGIRHEQVGFHALAGDFNTIAPGELLHVDKLPYRLRALVWLSGGRIRWQTIQVMLEAGYADAFRVMHPSEKGLTFPTWEPHVRLDYVFLPQLHVDRLHGCRVIDGVGARGASDHLPVLAEFEPVI